MGVKHLNKFIQLNANEGVIKTHLENLSGWVVAIDTSNYLYRFAKNGSMIRGLHNMINTLKRYEIIPLFVLDGVPPSEKTGLLNERRRDRYIALDNYNKLKSDNDTMMTTIDYTKMREYKRKSTYVSRYDVMNAVKLMDLMGVSYIKATGEADQLCSLLTIKGITNACMSEDMDMFVYGTNTVLRYLSLIHDNVVIYDYHTILNELDIPKDDFTSICVLSGSEYNNKYKYEDMISVFDIMNMYSRYRKSGSKLPFVKWITIFSHNIDTIDIGLFNRIIENYDINNDTLPDFKINSKIITTNNEIMDFVNGFVK